MAKRKIMRTFKLNEISAVTIPAQGPATMAIMKRAEEPTTKALDAVLLSDVDGHSHLIYDATEDGGTTSWSYAAGEETKDHQHPWVRGLDGEIVIGASAGHTHTIVKKVLAEVMVDKYGKQTVNVIHRDDEAAGLEKTQETDPMTTKTVEDQLAEATAAIAKADATSAELKKQLDTANAVAALSDVEKAHYNSLDADAQPVWLAKSADERKGDLAKAAEADAVVYTAADGSVFRKSDDPRLVAMAKDRDADRAEIAKAKEAAETAEFTKVANSDYVALPGDEVARVALAKAVSTITDEKVRGDVNTMLKSQASALAKTGETVGTVSTPVETGVAKADAQAKLDGLAKAHAEANKVTIEKAMTAVLETSEGAELYNAIG